MFEAFPDGKRIWIETYESKDVIGREFVTQQFTLGSRSETSSLRDVEATSVIIESKESEDEAIGVHQRRVEELVAEGYVISEVKPG